MDEPSDPQPGIVDGEAAFDVALDILDRLVAHAAHRISAERTKTIPDSDVIALWERRRDEWITRRAGLRLEDGLAVRAVLDEDAAFLRSLLST
jgi:hypothetical protein